METVQNDNTVYTQDANKAKIGRQCHKYRLGLSTFNERRSGHWQRKKLNYQHAGPYLFERATKKKWNLDFLATQTVVKVMTIRFISLEMATLVSPATSHCARFLTMFTMIGTLLEPEQFAIENVFVAKILWIFLHARSFVTELVNSV